MIFNILQNIPYAHSFIKKTLLCRFWLPFGYPEINKILSLQTKEIKSNKLWQQRKK